MLVDSDKSKVGNLVKKPILTRLSFLHLLQLALIVLPPILLFLIINHFAVNLVYADEWVVTDLIAKFRTGQLSLPDLWAQHNEHRILFPRLIFLLLASFGNWDVTREMFCSFFLAIIAFLLLLHLLLSTVGRKEFFWPALIISVLVFSAVQDQNWLIGFQVQWLMAFTGVVTAIWAAYTFPQKIFGFIVTIIATVVATYSLANGLLLWFVIPLTFLTPVLLNQTGKLPHKVRQFKFSLNLYVITIRLILRLQKIAFSKVPRLVYVWAGIGIVFISLYFLNYISPQPASASKGFALSTFLEFPYFVLALLGGPLGVWGGPLVSAGFGLIGCIALGLVTYWIFGKSSNLETPKKLTAIPWTQMILFVLANAFITFVGRAKFGVEELLTTRYTTINIFLWLGLTGLIFLAKKEAVIPMVVFRSVTAKLLLSIGLLFMVFGFSQSYFYGLNEIRNRHDQLAFVLNFLPDYKTTPNQVLGLIFIDPPKVRDYAKVLEKLNDGPFYNGFAAGYRQNLEDKWKKVLQSANYKVSNYSTKHLKTVLGDPKALNIKDDTIEFTNSGPTGTNFLLDATELHPQNIFGWENNSTEFVDIQAKTAAFVYVYWDTGKGLSIKELSMLYGAQDAFGWRHFREFIPAGVKSFRVDLHYVQNSPTNDTLKIDIYQR